MLRHANLETRACFRRIQDLYASKNFDLNFNVELVKKKKKNRERESTKSTGNTFPSIFASITLKFNLTQHSFDDIYELSNNK